MPSTAARALDSRDAVSASSGGGGRCASTNRSRQSIRTLAGPGRASAASSSPAAAAARAARAAGNPAGAAGATGPAHREAAEQAAGAVLVLVAVSAHVPRLAEGPVEGRYRRRVEGPVRVGEVEVRRPEQLDGGAARMPGRHERQHEVDRRREELGGQRQRAGRLVGDPGRGEQVAGRVEIRQRPLEHDRGALGRGPALHLPGDGQQLLLAVPPREVPPSRRRVRRDETRARAGRPGDRRLLDAGQQVREPLPIAGRQQRRRRHHVEPDEAGKASQQVEVPGPQAVAARGPVGDGQHHLRHRAAQPARQGRCPHPVLVDPARGRDPTLVGPEHPGEKPCLTQHSASAAIEIPARFQRLDEHPLEGVDLPPVAAQLVVEPEKLVDQSRPQVERRLDAGGPRLLGRRPPAHEPLDRAQPRRGLVRPAMQLAVEPVAGHQRREHQCRPLRQQPLLEGPPQLPGGRAGRHHDHRRTQVPGPVPVEAIGDRPTKRRQVRRAEKADPRRGSHGRTVRPGVRVGTTRTDCGKAVQFMCTECESPVEKSFFYAGTKGIVPGNREGVDRSSYLPSLDRHLQPATIPLSLSHSKTHRSIP